MEAVRSLRSIGDRLSLVICEGYDVSKVEALVGGVIANPLVAGDSIESPDESHRHSFESDRENVRVGFDESVSKTSVAHFCTLPFLFCECHRGGCDLLTRV